MKIHFLDGAREQLRVLRPEVKLHLEMHLENVAARCRPVSLASIETAMRHRGHLFDFRVGSFRVVYAAHPTTRAITVYRIDPIADRE